MALLGVVVGGGLTVFLAGAYLYARDLTALGGVLMGAALLGVLGGAIAIVAGAARESGGLPVSPSQRFADACRTRDFFPDDGRLCRCAQRAFDDTLAEYEELDVRPESVEVVVLGPDPARARFHERFAECGSPRAERWIVEACRADCDPRGDLCSSVCTCTGREVVAGRSHAAISYMFFPEPGPSPATRLTRVLTEAREICEAQGAGQAVPPRGFEGTEGAPGGPPPP